MAPSFPHLAEALAMACPGMCLKNMNPKVLKTTQRHMIASSSNVRDGVDSMERSQVEKASGLLSNAEEEEEVYTFSYFFFCYWLL